MKLEELKQLNPKEIEEIVKKNRQDIKEYSELLIGMDIVDYGTYEQMDEADRLYRQWVSSSKAEMKLITEHFPQYVI